MKKDDFKMIALVLHFMKFFLRLHQKLQKEVYIHKGLKLLI